MSPPNPGGAGDTSACAAIVARNDPHLYATALFAPEPARSRLMVLYAFDVELSRAALPSTEPLIPRIRLQWWRDVAEAARAGGPPPAHEVAGPFARLAGSDLPAAPVEDLIEAREAELAGGFDEARFTAWADARFGALTALAAGLLMGGDVATDPHSGAGTVAFARRAGLVLGTAFALRNAQLMAAEHRVLLPGLAPADRAALANSDLTAGARETIRRLAAAALARLAAMRAERRGIDRRATPALLPLARAGRVLRRIERLGDPPHRRSAPTAPAGEERAERGTGSAGAPGVGLVHLRDVDRPFDGFRLAWAAATGRW